MITASQETQSDWHIGFLVLSVPLFEIAGIVLKRPVSAYWALHYPRMEVSPWALLTYLFTAMFHMGSAALLVIIGFQFLQIGFKENTPDGLQCLMFLVFMLTLVKEAFFIVAVVPSSTNFFQQLYQNKIMTDQDKVLLRWLDCSPPKQITLGYALRNLLGELCLLVSSVILFTALWEFIISQSPLHRSWPIVIYEYLGATFFFGWIFLTARAISTMEGLVIQSAPNQRWWSVLSGTVIWLVTMLTLPHN
jgi:hypothetical protein